MILLILKLCEGDKTGKLEYWDWVGGAELEYWDIGVLEYWNIGIVWDAQNCGFTGDRPDWHRWSELSWNTPEVGTKRGMQTSCLASTVLTHTCTQRRKATQERKVISGLNGTTQVTFWGNLWEQKEIGGFAR